MPASEGAYEAAGAATNRTEIVDAVWAIAEKEIRAQVAAEIQAHADKHAPADGNMAQRRMHRHLLIAARVAAGHMSPAEVVQALNEWAARIAEVKVLRAELAQLTVERDKALKLAEAAKALVPLLWNLYETWCNVATVEAPKPYVEMLDVEDSFKVETAFSAILDRETEVRALMDALADAGLLLPPGGEVREEINRVSERHGDGPWRQVNATRTVTTWPDGTTLTSPWREVSG